MLHFFYMNPILIAAALIPAVFLLIWIYKADKLDKEPPLLLLSLVLYGILATALAVIAERVGGWILDVFLEKDSLLYRAIFYFIIVAFSEEGANIFS